MAAESFSGASSSGASSSGASSSGASSSGVSFSAVMAAARRALALLRAFVAGSMVASIAFALWGNNLLPASVDQMTASALAGLGLVTLKAIAAIASA